MSTGTSIKEKNKLKIQKPKKYQVVMHNDDFTAMEFVVFILINIFKKTNADAHEIMMTVHKGGRAIVGIYPLDIAKTKVDETTKLAREEGFPFRLTIEEV